MAALTPRERRLLAALCTLRAETSNSGNGVRWYNSERHKAEKLADKIIRELTGITGITA